MKYASTGNYNTCGLCHSRIYSMWLSLLAIGNNAYFRLNMKAVY